jgi:hypothetical protein
MTPMSGTIGGLLEASLCFGAGKVDVVCLRSREGGDGQGGSASYFLIEAIEREPLGQSKVTFRPKESKKMQSFARILALLWLAEPQAGVDRHCWG